MPTGLDLATCDKLLTTTRSVRKRLDFTRPIDPALIEQCIEIALQSPSSTNTQLWRFIVITDADKRAAVADVYRERFEVYWEESVAANPEAFENPSPGVQRMIDSAQYLAAHMQEAPVLVLFCIEEELLTASHFIQAGGYGSILPAAWSFMLAARARGLGCCWTTVHLMNAAAAAKVLGLPEGVTQTVLLPVAYYKGDDFKVAERIPAKEVTHWNGWGNHR
jgi:nitroreductase